MRNLSVAKHVETKFGSDDLPLTATTFDASTGEIICAFGPSIEKPVIELRRCKSWLKAREPETAVITSWDAVSPLDDLECDSILSLHYFHETSTICVVLAGGDLILVREKPQPDQERIEIVGSIDVGISAAQWSWNASFLAVITRAGSFVLMSQQLEPINEKALQQDDLKLSKHVSVGWGKKETQFQGKRAKAMKDPTMPDSVDEGKPSPNDDGKTMISWRGDGAYVAVNGPIASHRRVIRVYSAEGVLDSVSEPVDGLESALSWRPYGNLIAGIKRTTTGTPKLEVVFFERNGLRHGGFDLRLDEQEMATLGSSVSLSWNCDSSILAVTMRDIVQLWTMGNYHYYLKQELRHKAPSVKWHSTDPLCLCISNTRLKRSLSLDWRIDRGSTCPSFDYGLVAVIDGKKLKLTPLKHVNAPPPMAYVELVAGENIVSCAISRTCQRVAFLTDAYLYLCKWEMRQASAKADTAIRHTTNVTIEKKELSMFPRPTQVEILNDDAVFLLAPATSSSDPRASLHKLTWVNTTTQSEALRTQDVDIPLDTRQILLDTVQQSLWYRTSKEILPASMEYTMPIDDTYMTQLAKLPDDSMEPHLVVSLSKEQQLLLNGQVKASQVTSYAITESHIVYTTSNHMIKFVHLHTRDGFNFPGDTPEVDERCRAIERGAQIITVIPSTYAVVVQMPRGNLETIYPRILVLSGIRNHIRDLDFRTAFLACQKHQVDLNILYDYDPQLWSTNVDHFVDQLKKPGRIDEFLQKLKEEDVTKTLYHDTSKQSTSTNGINGTEHPQSTAEPSKVNSMCESLIAVLQKRPAEYQQNIITAHICKRPADTTAALELVSSLRETSQEEADLAISHLCFLTDANKLYDAALSLYDLELTLLVAQNAQRDPREYMPFLQSLQALPELRRRYTIDNHLKKYSKALHSLHALEAHNELEIYTVKYNLYATAEDLYKHDQPHLSRITLLHADHLSAQSQHSAAAILYESLSNYASAYPLYALSQQWRESLTCASLVPLSTPDLDTLAHSLATTCAEENRDYRSAAHIYATYLNDPLTAATLLCRSSYFADATLLLSNPAHNLSSQIPSIIDPALHRKFGEILELISDCQTQLASQVPRIEELRIKKAEDPLAFFGGDAAAGDGQDIPDNISLAATDASTLGGQSMFTRYGGGASGSQASTKFAGTVASNVSRRTSKTKKREDRKRARGKKGSVYEEEYLIASVGRLIERVNGTHDEVKRLLGGLRRRGMRDQAGKVEEIMAAIQEACEDARRRVWLQSIRNTGSEGSEYHVNENGRPPGADGGLHDSQIDAGAGKVTPEVKVWKREP